MRTVFDVRHALLRLALVLCTLVSPVAAEAALYAGLDVVEQRGSEVWLRGRGPIRVAPGDNILLRGLEGEDIVGRVERLDDQGRVLVRVGAHELVDPRHGCLPTQRGETTHHWFRPQNRRSGGALRVAATIGFDKRSAGTSAELDWRWPIGAVAVARVGEVERFTLGEEHLTSVLRSGARIGVGWNWGGFSAVLGVEWAQAEITVEHSPSDQRDSGSRGDLYSYVRLRLGADDGPQLEVETGGLGRATRAALPVRDGTVLGCRLSSDNLQAFIGPADRTSDVQVERERLGVSLRQRLTGDDGPGTRYLHVVVWGGRVAASSVAWTSTPADPDQIETFQERSDLGITLAWEWRL